MVSVKVCYTKTGKPVQGAKVAISFDGLLRGYHGDTRTDTQGLAHFNADPGSGKIFANGSEVYRGKIQGITVVYI